MCGKLLVAILPALLGSLERHGELHLASREGEALLSMSAATIDRRLRGISGDRSVLDLFAPVTRHQPLEASATPRRTGLAAVQ